ncbi:InlB B-repeat-containing protein [Pontibacter chitinilyticus]|uniref:glucuronyl esterase domain-containing protein n=1 Tax=Pontibacter chitinilyticus TaxID=2674989 RepID=UPI0032192EAB
MLFYTRYILVGLAGALSLLYCPPTQGQTINYDESKVGTYTLPDPLLLPDGQSITTSLQWTEQGRPRTLKLFKDNVYGQYPGKPAGMHFRVNSVDRSALNGLATRKQVTIFFSAAADAPSMEVLLYLPNNVAGPVPAFAGLNFYGNQCVSTDPGITITSRWVMNNSTYGITDHKATESSRGIQASRWPVEELLKQGFALVTAYYGDLEPDYSDGWKTGVRTTLQSSLGITSSNWAAIGTWAWGLSRMMDYIETEPAINAAQVAVTGHSRLGKAALWAGANDTRFALVVSNESGEGGAALARRNFGETITAINQKFPHWFSPAYKTYNNQPQNLLVDQHQLLSLIAPRPLYVCSAAEDLWSDPKGEFLSAWNATPVYKLFNLTGVGTSQMPAVEQPIGESVRYHIRSGKHDITLYDWQQHIAFAQKQFKLYSLQVATNGSGTASQSPQQVNYASGSSVTLTATPTAGYTFSGWSGSVISSTNPLTITIKSNITLTATFVSLTEQQVTGFNLINANTNTVIKPLREGDVLNLATLPTTKLNIQAATNPAKVGSVRFALSGTKARTVIENGAPYALFGDNNGDYYAWVPAVGSYTLTGTPYTAASATGTAGTPLTVHFKVVNSTAAVQATISSRAMADQRVNCYPNPFKEQFTLLLPASVTGFCSVALYDIFGRTVLWLPAVAPNQVLSLGKTLCAGVYVLQVQEGDKITRYKLVKQ